MDSGGAWSDTISSFGRNLSEADSVWARKEAEKMSRENRYFGERSWDWWRWMRQAIAVLAECKASHRRDGRGGDMV